MYYRGKKDCKFSTMSKIQSRPTRASLIAAILLVMVVFSTAQPSTIPSEHTFLPLPDPLVNLQGKIIETPQQWETSRREEVLELFRDHVYGHVPETDLALDYQVTYLNRDALDGKAIVKEVEIRASNGTVMHTFPVLLFLPKDATGPVPVFLGMNFRGNHTIHPDDRISLTESWVPNDTELGYAENRISEESRGGRAHRWPVDLILERGYGLATVYAGDIDPDFDDGFTNGIHAIIPQGSSDPDPGAWGTIATWAWGLSRVLDYLESDPDVDHESVAVIGHSRMGKTALWAGAEDERFAMVISNNSGCGGAALSRRAFGERVSRINTAFPHWFADRFNIYNDNEVALPVDQHMLLALVAPRPLYVASAQEDDWADPHGEYLSLYYSSRVYQLYGNEPLEEAQLPEVDQPLWRGKLGYHIRTGKHDVTRYDWEQYIGFADQHLTSTASDEFENPITMEWISEHLKGSRPRLILTPEVEARVRAKIDAGDAITSTGCKLLHRHAELILDLEPLEYRKTGRRLLGVSREAIRRLTTLAMEYRLERDERFLVKLEEELKAVCTFDDWNPSHFLDVAEMAAGIALALDWAGEWLSPEVYGKARKALVEKALIPGLAASGNNFWIDAHHNWNLVCHGGLSLAALEVYEDVPEIASRILHQAVEKIPLALQPYAPDGIYPEGASYWFYATTYLTVAISAFESALGTDFEFTVAQGVMESALFSQVLAAPSGDYYNYFDASLGGYQNLTHFGLLSWFAGRLGSGVDWKAYDSLLRKELGDPPSAGSHRFFPCFLLNTAVADHGKAETFAFPAVWTGDGEEPLVVFRDPENDRDAFFLAAKGGRAADNHGNMDAGSFILEMDGVRWSVDPGNQNYNELEQLMGNALWSSAQNSRRWSLLTKNNFGHSTLTVNGEMHTADARATLIREERRTDQAEVTFDLSPLFGQNMEKAHRSFIRISEDELKIVDNLACSPHTRLVTWQMMTQAEVTVQKDHLVLSQDGHTLYLMVVSKGSSEVEVVDLSPPPLPYDKEIPDLKRIDIHFESDSFQGSKGVIEVVLSRKPLTK